MHACQSPHGRGRPHARPPYVQPRPPPVIIHKVNNVFGFWVRSSIIQAYTLFVQAKVMRWCLGHVTIGVLAQGGEVAIIHPSRGGSKGVWKDPKGKAILFKVVHFSISFLFSKVTMVMPQSDRRRRKPFATHLHGPRSPGHPTAFWSPRMPNGQWLMPQSV